MSRSIFAAAVVALLASPAFGADRSFPLAGFNQVHVAGADGVSIRNGAFAVSATGAHADLDRLDVRVEDGALKIGRKKGNWGWNSQRVSFVVTLPALAGVKVAGSADVDADSARGERFEGAVSGSGGLKLGTVTAPAVRLALSGSGGVTAAGRCQALEVSVSGSGSAQLSKLQCNTASVRVAGSGAVNAHASQTADIRKAGSGAVRITGGARCTTKVAGSGRVDCG